MYISACINVLCPLLKNASATSSTQNSIQAIARTHTSNPLGQGASRRAQCCGRNTGGTGTQNTATSKTTWHRFISWTALQGLTRLLAKGANKLAST